MCYGVPVQACKDKNFKNKMPVKWHFCIGHILKTLTCTSAVHACGNNAQVLLFGTSHTENNIFEMNLETVSNSTHVNKLRIVNGSFLHWTIINKKMIKCLYHRHEIAIPEFFHNKNNFAQVKANGSSLLVACDALSGIHWP